MLIDLSIAYFILVAYVVADFLETSEAFSVSEDAVVGSRIGRVRLTSGSNYRVSGVNHYFDFDPQTGWISLRRELDREREGKVELLLIATPPSLIHVYITILDVNDNQPTFPVPFQNISVIESSAVGTRLPLLSATDPDAGANGTIVEYGIEGDTDEFGLIVEEPNLLYLKVKKPLDRESHQFVMLNVSAKDGGQPSKVGYTTVYVEILDVNDNAPTFGTREIEAKWSGHAEVPIFTMNATDADRGTNGEVTYGIIGPGSAQFRVNGSQVFAKADFPPCCTTPPCTVCFVSVRATDRGTPPLESTVLLKVLVSNENLHDPRITIKNDSIFMLHPSTVDFALIETGATVGKTIAVLTVTDDDGPLSESASIWIESGNEDDVFNLNTQKHFSSLRLLKSIEDIAKAEYNLLFVASDGQVPQRLASATLKVYNEALLAASPVIIERELSVSIREDSPIGSYVAQVHTNSSGCRFAMKEDNPFDVDQKSGTIITKSTLDVNIADNYVLEVQVQLPQPSISTVTATVTVKITDVNNHAPTFVNLPDQLSIFEDERVGTVITTLKAVDNDRGENARLTFRLLNEVAIEYLSIDSDSGKITLRKIVDFEVLRGFDMEIEACDHGEPMLCTPTLLAVSILDVNDNTPMFPCDTMHVVLPVNSPPGTVVATVSAVDRDFAGVVHYVLLDATTGFVLDRSTGVIRSTELLHEKQYKFRIGAIDNDGLMSSNNITVTLITTKETPLTWTEGPAVIDFDEYSEATGELARYQTNLPSVIEVRSPVISIDAQNTLRLSQALPPNIEQFHAVLIARSKDLLISKCVEVRVKKEPPPPSFSKATMSIRLQRDSPVGKPITKVNAGPHCNYSTDCRWLRIDRNGTMTIKELVDKSVNSVQCTVVAKDVRGRKDSLKVHLAMVGEETPLHLNATYNVHVREDARAGTMLTTLGTNPAYVFKSKFKTRIDVFPDGTVYLREEVDIRDADVISVPIIATHRTLNNTYSTMVHVFIDSVNKHSPRCPDRGSFEITENAKIGSLIGYLEAQDDDFGLNGVIAYRLLDNQDLIQIGVVTGKITTSAMYDAEQLMEINFKYEVYDHGSPSKAVLCNATVVVTDLNDNAPVFDRDVYSVAVNSSDSSEERIIVTVGAKDKDRSAKITYKLLNYQHLFKIDAHTGEVSRRGRLRPDSRFNVSVAADDGDGQTTKTVLIITTSSDYSAEPMFDKMEPFRISQTTPIGSVIGGIRAVAGRQVVKYHIFDERFEVDSWGNVIITEELEPGAHELIVMASTATRNATALQRIVVDIGDTSMGGRTFRVKENSAPETIADLGDDFELLLTVPETSAFTSASRKLILKAPLDYENCSTYRLLVGNGRSSQLVTVEVMDVNDNDPVCDITAIIVDKLPFHTVFRCTDLDTEEKFKLTYRTTASEAQISPDGQLTVMLLNGTITSISIDVINAVNSTNRHRTNATVHLIHGATTDHDIIFPSNEISLLVTSSQPIGTTLGRITAESVTPLRYFVNGSSSIEIDEDSGVVSKKRRTLENETATIVAVSETGIATAKVHIELIEDALIVPRNAFLFVPSTLASGQALGQIDVGRSDVTLELTDPYIFYRGKELYLKKSLDFKGRFYYECTATIREGKLSSSIKIYVIPPNRTISQQNNTLLQFWVRENAPKGTVVGRALKSHKGPVAYSILGDVGLTIDRKSGLIRADVVFDHEMRQLYSFKIRLTLDSGDYSDRDALLVIDDENDNAPKFKHDLYKVEIAEDLEAGTEILKLHWTDQDYNNAFHFAIVEGNELGHFEIGTTGSLYVVGGLDRERSATHRLVIRLWDGIAPYPYHTAECTVVVNLVDINDNAPVFESASEFLVEENSPRFKIFDFDDQQTYLGRIRAVDADEGLNAAIHYRILPESLPRAEFVIDGVRGDLMVNKALDYEKRQNYTFMVAAMDYGNPPLQSVQQTTVYVADVNDHEPILSSSSDSVIVDEVTSRGSTILQFEVEDNDCLENAASVFRIETGYGIFDVTPMSGQLYLSSPFDFELQAQYNVTVSARNIAGGEKKYKSVIVNVADSNDEQPRFVGGSPVHFSVYENLPGPFPAIIGSTISEDLDSGENGLVAYSVFKGNASLFSINSATGELLLLSALDREDSVEHFISVQATDSGSPRLSSTADIKVTVLDDNDNAPQFNQPYYMVHVTENVQIGYKVLQIVASDRDEGQNAVVRYSFLERSPFVIDKSSGEVRVASPVDREVSSIYNLTIQATDLGRYRRLSSTAPLTIIIDDENDNVPVIRNKLLDVFVSKDLKIGDVVHVVDAVDFDQNSTLIFNLSGPDARFFSISGAGEIRSKIPLELKAYYSITVSVFDAYGNNTSASFTFYILEPKLFPKWKSTMKSKTMRENSSSDIFRFSAKPSRNDLYITYSVLSGNDGCFEIDPLLGRLSISRSLDRETRASYRLWIAATDSDNPPKLSITSIDIDLEDVNDNKPVFEKVIYSVEVLENSDPQNLLCVSATDRDIGNNGNVSYAIVDGDSEGSFAIDPWTGCVKSTAMLDREHRADYRLVIRAKDHGVPPLSTEAIVKVEVMDEDDNAPKFSHLFHAEVPENLEIGSHILLVSASDPDDYTNHSFAIDNKEDTPFTINTLTGQIYLKELLDREKQSSYRLQVSVSDGTWTVQTGAAISVLDVNDNAPAFEKSNYAFVVSGSQVNESIGKVTANDADEGDNGAVRYRLERDSRYIAIDTVTGELRLLSVPNTGVAMLIVTAHDDGVPPMLSSVPVTVVVSPMNIDVCEIAVGKDAVEGMNLGTVEDRCADIVEPKAMRTFSLDESLLMINSQEELILTAELQEDVSIGIARQMATGEAQLLNLLLVLSGGNKNSPQFDEKIFHFTIMEDIAEGVSVGVVTASDADVGPAARLRFYIEAAPSAELPFRVLSNGSILVAGSLDYEGQRRYVFNVTAVDGAHPPRRASAQVVVDLLDVDDNAPAFKDAELAYAVTKVDDTICPEVFDTDTARSDLTFSAYPNTVSPNADGCITVSGRVPSSVEWTVGDENQSATVKIVLVDMIPKEPIISDRNVTLSVNAIPETILSSYEAAVFVEPTDHFSVSGTAVMVSGRRGLVTGNLTVYAKSKFGRILKRSNLRISPSSIAPSPVFSTSTQVINVSDATVPNTVVHDFQLTLPNDCRMEIAEGNHPQAFCLSNEHLLSVCRRLRRPFYRLLVEVVCGNMTRSRSEVVVTVVRGDVEKLPIVGFVLENVAPIAVAQLPTAGARIVSSRVGDKQLRELFTMTAENMLVALRPLNLPRRSVYDVPVLMQLEGERPTTRHFIVLVDADRESQPAHSHANVTVMLRSTTSVVEMDLAKEVFEDPASTCSSLDAEGLTVSTKCHISVEKPIDNASVTIWINGTKAEVVLRARKNFEELDKSAVQVVLYATKAGVADFLTELEQFFSDLTFYPLAIDVLGRYRSSLALAVVDRNRRVIAANDTRDILRGFFQKDVFLHALLQSIRTNMCDERDSCLNGGSCQQLVLLVNRSSTFLGSRSMWNIPSGILTSRCNCASGFGGEFCDEVDYCGSNNCPEKVCSDREDCRRECERNCENGLCYDGVCECRFGFAGADCSLRVSGQKHDRKSKKRLEKITKKRKSKCSELNCGDGACRTQNGFAICHCVEGFQATDCSHGITAVSVKTGYVTLAPTDLLRRSISMGDLSVEVEPFCNGTRSIEIDFRTQKSHGTIVSLSYEAAFAVIEVHSSALRYRVFDSYRIPVEITLGGRSVDDGNWHRVVLELSEDRKMIVFKVDGVGKQALSRMVLPSFISSDLKRIQLGINGVRGQFYGCLRRFVINGQLQLLGDDEKYSSEFFTKSFSGDIAVGCSLGSSQMALFHRPGLLASLICLVVLGAAAAVVAVVARTVRQREICRGEHTWHRTQEIDAYALQKPRSSADHGHINRAMSTSQDGSIYASADGYEKPIHQRQQQRKIKTAMKPSRTHDDVVLAIRPSLSDIGRHVAPTGKSDSQGAPPQRMYRNIAYF